MRRVVVTGMGPITPVGIGVDAFWTALIEGRSGIARITAFDPAEYPTQIAGEIRDWKPELYIDRKEARRMDRFAQFAVVGAGLALAQARLEITPDIAERIGVYVGSGIGGLATWEEQHSLLLSRGPRRVSPFFIPMMISDMASGPISI
ncbi:MAG: beta-ketoacyl synthase N-terminal-like domain-containing protein, partial [Firmicutes bacterium]|nr:beta-ketoacyl synthase N-terminal-like domain-containing protein [Bacillota bacterium]